MPKKKQRTPAKEGYQPSYGDQKKGYQPSNTGAADAHAIIKNPPSGGSSVTTPTDSKK